MKARYTPLHDEQTEYQSLLVRVWRNAETWQGELELIQSQQNLPFTSVEQLHQLLDELLPSPKGYCKK